MDNSKQRKIGTLLGYIHIALQSLVSIIYIPLLINGIGDGEYGLYQIMSSIIAYFSIMEAPMSSAILRFYSQYKNESDINKMENVLAIGKNIFSVISLIVIIIAIPCLFGIYSLYKNSFTNAELIEAVIMFIIMTINIVITIRNYVYVAAISANEKYIFIKIVSIVTLIIQPVGVYSLIYKYPYALTIVLIQLILTIIVSLIRKHYAIQRLNISIKYHGKDKNLTNQMMRLALSVLFVALADQIFWKTDQIIIGRIYDTSHVAIYSVGAQLNSMYISIACVLGNIMMPMATQIFYQKDGEKKLSILFCKMGRIQTLITGLIISGVVLFGKEFICIISNQKYMDAYYVALFLMIPYTIDLIQICGGTVLQIKDEYKFRACTMFIMAVLNIGLTIILTEKIGIIGAAISTMISIFVGSGLIMNFVYFKYIKLDISTFWKTILPIFSKIIICTLLGHIINYIRIDNQYVQFLIHVVMYSVIYFSFMYITVLNQEEKKQLETIVKKFRNNY